MQGETETQDFDLLITRLPAQVVDSLDDDQKTAIHQVVTESTWRTHPIDIRYSLPFFGRRYYLTVVAGEEKRTPQRRQVHEDAPSRLSLGNLLFVMGVGSLFFMALLAALALQSALVEF
ncbi:hypothetical protein [Magnetospira sp. QH-2]|uniref:hypothetical protein n=1 Tax=Magnetospira sp. (strain QH-2) TaxID=1288970 RepID=UPI0006976BED|nr:hypothetical protein [Magnetospira sp. QH-2]